MLPFLKNKHEASASMPVDVVERSPDEGSEPFEMLDAIAEDMIEASKSGNKKLLKSALEALCEYIQEEDEVQDESLTNKGLEQ